MRRTATIARPVHLLSACAVIVAVLLVVAGSAQARGMTRRISLPFQSGQFLNATSESKQADISADGCWAVFVSSASEYLHPTTLGNGYTQIYRVHLCGGQYEIQLVSDRAGAPETPGNGDSSEPRISADGQNVVFTSYATDIDSRASTGKAQVFMRNMTTTSAKVVTLNRAGQIGNGASHQPDIDYTGQWAAFASDSSNLLPQGSGDNRGYDNVYRVNLLTGQVDLASVQRTGGMVSDAGSFEPSISASGEYVAFTSLSGQLSDRVPQTGLNHVYRWRAGSNAVTLVSVVDNTSIPATGSRPSIDYGGTFVAFDTTDSLVPLDKNTRSDIYAREMGTTFTSYNVDLVSRHYGPVAEQRDSYFPSFAQVRDPAPGRGIAFESDSADVTTGPTPSGAPKQIFICETQSPSIGDCISRPASRNNDEQWGDGASGRPSLAMKYPSLTSPTQFRLVVFQSDAENLDDPNLKIGGFDPRVTDVFVHDPLAGTLLRRVLGRPYR